MRPRRADGALALLLCLLTTLTLSLASRSLGYTRDEGYYFQAGQNHVRYLERSLEGLRHGAPLTFAKRAVIEQGFSYNNEHPPLMKTLFGISWRLLGNRFGVQEGQAMRLPAAALAGLAVAAVYLFGAATYGRLAGLGAAALTILAPRHFFHAQLACFDAPIAAMITLTTLSYYAAQVSGRRRWLVLTGILAGLSLSTKHNAFFLPFALLPHSLYLRRAILRGPGSLLVRALRWIFAPWVLYMAALSIPVYLLSWPWLWYDGLRRFGGYVAFHLHHVYYNIEYLGQNYNKPPFPWHYAFVTTLLTAPVMTLLLAAIGAASLRRRPPLPAAGPREGHPGLLIAIALLWPMLLIARPGTPIFGAEKHWLPSVPFLALLAGVGLRFVFDQCQRHFARPAPLIAAPLLLLALLPPALEVRRSHPYGLSHYNALAGGPQGAATLGMNRQFWGYAVRGLFPFLNAKAPPAAPIYWHDANWYQLQWSMRDRLLRGDLRDTGLEEPGVRAADLALVIHEMHFNKYEYWIWDAFGATRPVAVVTHEGVPLVTLYSRSPLP